MGMIDYTKANSFLDNNKLSFASNADMDPELQRAAALILGRLRESYPTAEATWTTPVATPALIQDICGALCASWRYSKVYSEEQVSTSSFAVALEKRALDTLEGVAKGKFVLTSSDEGLNQITSNDFYPNDATDDDEDNARRFTMGMTF